MDSPATSKPMSTMSILRLWNEGYQSMPHAGVHKPLI